MSELEGFLEFIEFLFTASMNLSSSVNSFCFLNFKLVIVVCELVIGICSCSELVLISKHYTHNRVVSVF